MAEDDDDPFFVVNKPSDGDRKMSNYLRKQGSLATKCTETSSQGTSSTRSTNMTESSNSSQQRKSSNSMEDNTNNNNAFFPTGDFGSTTATNNNSSAFPNNDKPIEFSSDFGNGLEFGSGGFGMATTNSNSDPFATGGDAFADFPPASTSPFPDGDNDGFNNNGSSTGFDQDFGLGAFGVERQEPIKFADDDDADDDLQGSFHSFGSMEDSNHDDSKHSKEANGEETGRSSSRRRENSKGKGRSRSKSAKEGRHRHRSSRSGSHDHDANDTKDGKEKSSSSSGDKKDKSSSSSSDRRSRRRGSRDSQDLLIETDDNKRSSSPKQSSSSRKDPQRSAPSRTRSSRQRRATMSHSSSSHSNASSQGSEQSTESQHEQQYQYEQQQSKPRSDRARRRASLAHTGYTDNDPLPSSSGHQRTSRRRQSMDGFGGEEFTSELKQASTNRENGARQRSRRRQSMDGFGGEAFSTELKQASTTRENGVRQRSRRRQSMDGFGVNEFVSELKQVSTKMESENRIKSARPRQNAVGVTGGSFDAFAAELKNQAAQASTAITDSGDQAEQKWKRDRSRNQQAIMDMYKDTTITPVAPDVSASLGTDDDFVAIQRQAALAAADPPPKPRSQRRASLTFSRKPKTPDPANAKKSYVGKDIEGRSRTSLFERVTAPDAGDGNFNDDSNHQNDSNHGSKSSSYSDRVLKSKK